MKKIEAIKSVELTISSPPSTAFEGRSFANIGQYEQIYGRAHIQFDPNAAALAQITDIGAIAPQHAVVETDFFILRPSDHTKSNRRLFVELNNRGFMRCLQVLNDESGNPTPDQLGGNGFLLNQGYTILVLGWDANVQLSASNDPMQAPLRFGLKVPQINAISGPALEEFAIDMPTQHCSLTYPAATTETDQAELTIRKHVNDSPEVIMSDDWHYLNPSQIQLKSGQFTANRIYELRYQAQGTKVSGLGYLAVNALVGYLRYENDDNNPLANAIDYVYSFAVSQPARFMHDFIHLGFNRYDGLQQGANKQTKNIVFDGILNYLAGASSGFFNYRFAQTTRTHRQRIGRNTPEIHFPFAYHDLVDPFSQQQGGRLNPNETTQSQLKIIEINSANEYWVKVGSLLHTDCESKQDLAQLDNVRTYLLSSFPHAAANPFIDNPYTDQAFNPLRANPTLRAYLVILDQWVSQAKLPPDNALPRIDNQTLVSPESQTEVGFPSIPNVRFNGAHHEGDLLDFGPEFKSGILLELPPTKTRPYRPLVPKTDSDGNDIAGIRTLDLLVPLGTFTGWSLRKGLDDCGDAFGQFIPFAQTKAQRLQNGDPRLSIEERYPNRDHYQQALRHAAEQLLVDRSLLASDVDNEISRLLRLYDRLVG